MYLTYDTPPRTAEYELVKQSFHRLESDPGGAGLSPVGTPVDCTGIRSLFPANYTQCHAQIIKWSHLYCAFARPRPAGGGAANSGAAMSWRRPCTRALLCGRHSADLGRRAAVGHALRCEEIERAWWAAQRTVCAMMMHAQVNWSWPMWIDVTGACDIEGTTIPHGRMVPMDGERKQFLFVVRIVARAKIPSRSREWRGCSGTSRRSHAPALPVETCPVCWPWKWKRRSLSPKAAQDQRQDRFFSCSGSPPAAAVDTLVSFTNASLLCIPELEQHCAAIRRSTGSSSRRC